MEIISTHYKSLITNKLYNKEEYCNHEYGGVSRGYKDLLHDEYPYTLVYEETKPKWIKNE